MQLAAPRKRGWWGKGDPTELFRHEKETKNRRGPGQAPTILFGQKENLVAGLPQFISSTVDIKLTIEIAADAMNAINFAVMA